MADTTNDDLAAKINPPWWRTLRAAEVRREIADQELQRLMKLEPGIWDILTAARTQKFSTGYNRICTYYELKSRVESLVGSRVGTEARKRGLATIKAFRTVVRAMSELIPPDVSDLLQTGDLSDEDVEELEAD